MIAIDVAKVLRILSQNLITTATNNPPAAWTSTKHQTRASKPAKMDVDDEVLELEEPLPLDQYTSKFNPNEKTANCTFLTAIEDDAAAGAVLRIFSKYTDAKAEHMAQTTTANIPVKNSEE